jgi:hypothetical protein
MLGLGFPSFTEFTESNDHAESLALHAQPSSFPSTLSFPRILSPNTHLHMSSTTTTPTDTEKPTFELEENVQGTVLALAFVPCYLRFHFKQNTSPIHLEIEKTASLLQPDFDDPNISTEDIVLGLFGTFSPLVNSSQQTNHDVLPFLGIIHLQRTTLRTPKYAQQSPT